MDRITPIRKVKAPNAGKTAFIYILVDPREPNIVRYIGKTNNPEGRLYKHFQSRERRITRKDRWIQSLQKSGVSPLMEIIDKAPHDDQSEWQELERFYIAYLRFLGCDLTNLSVGGHGGGSLSEETKQKLRELRNTPEFKAAVSARHKGMKFTEEQRKRMGDGHRGFRFSDESKRKLSEAKKGKPFSESHRAALSKSAATRKRRICTPEMRANMSAAANLRKSRKATLIHN